MPFRNYGSAQIAAERPALRAVIIVPHTHWDREWYDTADRFRQRLVEVMEGVQAGLSSSASESVFLLDGQLVAVEDYLSVVPERREAVSILAATNKLLIGPWYVLADELLVRDETLVRNLLAGQRVGRGLGSWLSVGYLPDSFGHPAAMPTILAGFAIEAAILWRGYGGEPGQDGDLFIWRGPDGSSVLVNHLPPSGYEFGAELPATREALAARWKEMRATLAARTVTGVALVLNGADHHALQPDLPAALSLLRELDPDVEFCVAGPSAYFDPVRGATGLSQVTGELRFSYRYTWTLQGIHATRARLKQTMAACEHLLIRWAEPVAALAQWEGGRDRRPELREVWKAYLRCCAHDSIGGCCTDEVAVHVSHRASRAGSSARALFVDSLFERLGVDRTRSRRGQREWRPSVVIVNSTPRPRHGVVEATVCRFLRHVRVGPGSRVVTTQDEDPFAWSEAPVVRDARGRALPIQILGEYEGYERFDSPRDYPDHDVVRAVRVAIAAADVPALGAATCAVEFCRPDHDPRRPATIDRAVGIDGDTLVSDSLRISADRDAGWSVDLVNGGEVLARVAQIVSELDGGDTYTFQPVDGDRPVEANWGAVRVADAGPLVASIGREFTVPGRASGVLHARIDCGSNLVRFVVAGTNECSGHRLRIHFPLRDTVGSSVADMHYGPVTRRRARYDRGDFPMEWPVTTAPMHRYVSVGSGERGCTIFSRGLYEYELCDESVAITLLRAVSELSRDNLPARPGHAGYPAPTPDAMELGPFRAELGIAFLGVSEDSAPDAWAAIEDVADEFHVPLTGVMIRQAIDLPDEIRGPLLRGNGLVCKSVKWVEEGEALVLRCVNVTRQTVTGFWQMPFPVTRACQARLDETPIRELQLDDGSARFAFDAAPREVVTVLVWR